MKLTPEQLHQYHQDGFLVLADFVAESACDSLRARAEELVQNFDPQGIVSIFSTREQNRLSDDYFLESGDKIRFFFEEDAFLPDGRLKQTKEKSINKIGHALHDLDPEFDRFSRAPEIKQLIGFSASRIRFSCNRCTYSSSHGSVVKSLATRTAVSFIANLVQLPAFGSRWKMPLSKMDAYG